MKALKKGLCLAVALAVVLQVFSFMPVMAEETVTAVELGEPAYMYNVVQGDPNAVTDGDTGTVWDFDRQRLGATWISALVYDAGDGMTFDFNRITLNGTGCRFYGADGEGNLADIGAVLDADTDYSGDDGYQAFADTLGIEPIGWLTNGNNWLDGDYDCEDVLSYRYFVVVPYTGWTHARVGEVSLSLVEQVSESETRTVTFDEKAEVTVDGETVLSGESVEVGKTLVITPVIPDGEELVSVSVNGEEIEAPYEYGVADEDIVITVETQAVGPQEPQYLQELGEPAYGFNRHGGDPAAMTDGDPDTAYNFGRGGTGPSWIVAEVYDAGDINKFQFNKASLIGTGVYIYGADGEGQLADIGAALEADTDYSTDPALFSDALGVDLICALQPADANRGGEAEWIGDTAEYRYIAVVLNAGWPNANVNELTLELLSEEELNLRTVTFGDDVTVTADGTAMESGDKAADGTVLEITPLLADGEVLDAVLVNGTAIDGTSFTVDGENVEITLQKHMKEVLRTVTFGENVRVYADNEEITSGSQVAVGKTLTITPVLADDQELDSVTVNGEEIEAPYSYAVGGEDITIEVKSHTVEREPQMLQELGEPAYLFNHVGGNPAAMTDGDPASAYVFKRELTAPTWIMAAVYDAGAMNKFEFNRIELVSATSVRFFGTDEAFNGGYDITNIAGTIGENNYSEDLDAFGEMYGLTDLADLNNGYKNFAEVRRFRYIVAVLYNGWPNANVGEITLKNISPDEFETHTVTFGDNVKVTVDGEEITGGSQVAETRILVITPVLAEGEKLAAVLVNGQPIEEPYSYVVGAEDVNIEIRLIELRTVTFGEDISVTADGSALNSGDRVMEGTVIEITPTLPENSVLDSILVNGSPIEGSSFTVGAENVEITFTVIYKRLVTFGENIRVTAGGEPVESGERVLEGTELAVEAVLAEGEILDRILVNGVAIEGSTFTVGGADVEITLELVAIDPDAVPLGKAAWVYNIPAGNVDYLTDGRKSTALEFRRNDIEDTWISVVIYDAGEGNTFDFSSIELTGYDRARFYGANSLVSGNFDLSDIAGTIERNHDYSKDEYFAQCYGLTALADLTNSSKTFDDTQSYRYFVVTITDGWNRNTSISEIALSNKIVAASLGEVVRAGGQYTSKTGKWSSTNFNAQWSVTDSDLGITAGTDENLTLWGWLGGDGSDTSSDAGVISFRLKSETDTYADVKIVGNEKQDDRDFTVWVQGEDGRTSQGYVITTGQGESLGNLTLYTVKNIQVFEGVNKITIGSSQFDYAPDLAMAVFVDKADSFLRVGEVKWAEGETADMGGLASADKFTEEFLPGKVQGDALGGLASADGMTAEVMSEGGTYNLIALAGEGGFTLNVGGKEYSAEAESTEYSSVGGLRAVVFRDVALNAGIDALTLTGGGIVGLKLIEQRNNTLTFGDEITVVADGKIVNSGETVPDGATVNITAFSSDDRILDKILVNGREISGGKYFVFNEDINITAEFIDVMYVTVTFDGGIVVLANGTAIESGASVRGDASLRFSAGNSAEIRAVFSVNGTPISGSTYTLNKEDVHISVELTPYDLIFLQNYVIEVFDETENAMRFTLPARGDYGAEITWTVVSGEETDSIDAAGDGLLLTADLAAGRDREIVLNASITVAGQTYTVEKTVKVESHSLVSIGGRSFYISPIGGSEADLVMNDGQFAVSGRGEDLWRAPDGFGYLYTRLSDEDFTVSVKADKIDGSAQWRRTGLMLRESTDPGSRFVMLSFGAQNGAGLELAVRDAEGAEPYSAFRDTGYVRGRTSFGYIKLEKRGNTVTAYYSEDGTDYAAIGDPVEFALEGEYLAGIHAVSDEGYSYFSRFEINGEDVLVSGGISGAAAEPSDGKLLVTWIDPAEYSSFTFETVEVTASAEGAETVTAEAEKGAERAVLEGLVNGTEYTVSLRAKTGTLCSGGENNATPYNALGKAVTLTAMPFSAADYAAKTPAVNMTVGGQVMVGERNRVTLAFAEPQPAASYELTVKFPAGVAVPEDSISPAAGCTVNVSGGGLVINYTGDNSPVTEIASFVLVADNVGGYEITVEGTASYYSFESGTLTAAPAALASARVDVVDVQYVTLTFDDGITALIDGLPVASGASVRGDSVIELSCGVPEGALVTYSVNGEPVEGSTVTLSRVDTHISVEILPLDVKFVREYELVPRTETEEGVLYDLPMSGEYGHITWSLKDQSFGDTITELDYQTACLTVNMADNGYVGRSVTVVASVTFNGQTYTVEKTVYAESGILRQLGGRNFFVRQVGQDDQSTAGVEISNHQIALSGYGTDLWNAPDSFGYFYTKSGDGDFTVSVKIDRQEGSNQWRRSGLMFRQSDGENEKMVMLDVGANNGAALEFAYRVGTTGSATQLARSYNHGDSIWLKLEKKANKFYAYYSADGLEYTLVSEAPATVRMDGDYLVGIFSESETGRTWFSRLELNGSDVFVSDNIINAAAIASNGKIKVTWTDPTEENTRTYEDILVTVTDSLGRQRSDSVAKGAQEVTFDGLPNGIMYTVTVQARTAELCGENADNGAVAYRALSAPVTLRAFPVDFEYLAAVKPTVDISGKKSVVVGQTDRLSLAFADMQPIYRLELTVDIPGGLSLGKNDVTLSEELAGAGAEYSVEDGRFTLKYEAENADGVIYVTDIGQLGFGAVRRGDYTVEAEGTVTYYSFESGEIETSVNEKSAFSFEVESSGSSGGSGSGGGHGGSGSGGGSGTVSGGVSYNPFTGVAQEVPKIPDGTDVFADKADIPDWAATAVGRLAEQNIISGSETEAGLVFRPNTPITREEFVKICVSAFMKADPNAKCDFTDVDASAWYAPYVATMVQAGVIQGYSDGRFGVGDLITRQDMAVIIYRLFMAGYIDLTSGPVTPFDDNGAISDYAIEAVTALRAAGVVDGYSGNVFAPSDNLTRAMAAKIVYGCLN